MSITRNKFSRALALTLLVSVLMSGCADTKAAKLRESELESIRESVEAGQFNFEIPDDLKAGAELDNYLAETAQTYIGDSDFDTLLKFVGRLDEIGYEQDEVRTGICNYYSALTPMEKMHFLELFPFRSFYRPEDELKDKDLFGAVMQYVGENAPEPLYFRKHTAGYYLDDEDERDKYSEGSSYYKRSEYYYSGDFALENFRGEGWDSDYNIYTMSGEALHFKGTKIQGREKIPEPSNVLFSEPYLIIIDDNTAWIYNSGSGMLILDYAMSDEEKDSLNEMIPRSGDELWMEERLNYIKDNYNTENVQTYEYLVALIEAGSEEAAEFYSGLYEVSAKIISNSDKSDTNSDSAYFNADMQNYFGYFHHYISSNAPAQTIKLHVVLTKSDKYISRVEADFTEEESLNSWYYFGYNNLLGEYEYEYAVYDAYSGELLGTHTVFAKGTR